MILLLKSKFVWHEKEKTGYESVRSELHPEIERLFLERALGDIDDLKAETKNEGVWHDPFKFKDMQLVIDRIKKAITDGEAILVYGDYDADGVTSTALLIKALRCLGADAHFYIPHRFFEGYGPNADAFTQAVRDGYKLIITVDCGITGITEAEILKENDVDLIIIDHHHPKEKIPYAIAIIHPEYDENYPFNHLAGAGVTLKVVEALRNGQLEDDDYMLAMFGTIGDVVNLINENRSIVKKGLSAFRKTTSPSVLALLQVAEINQYDVDETTVGYNVCPRLNAPGRMDDANMVVEFLLAEDQLAAMAYAQELEIMNSQRKLVTSEITEAAIELAKMKELDNLKALVLYQPDWHEGVLGIVASKLVEQFAKAVVVLTNSEEDSIKGSARSPAGLDLLSALIANEDLLIRYGGHENAAGLLLAAANLEALELGLNEALASSTVARTMTVDLQMELEELDFKWLADVAYLAPFGQGNKRPVVKLSSVQIKHVKRIGATHEHLKFMMYTEKSSIDTIFFGGAKTFIYLTPEAKFDVLCEIEINEWNGNKKLQARIIDIKCDAHQLLDLRNQKLDAEFGTRIDDGFVIDRIFDSKESLKTAYLASGARNVVLKRVEAMTMPSRLQFVFVYQTAKAYAPFQLTPDIITFFEKGGIPKAMLLFIVRVFTEVELFDYDATGVVSLNEANKKVDFKLATSYINRAAKVALHEFLELQTADEILKFMIGEE